MNKKLKPFKLQTHRDHRYDYVREASERERKMLVGAQPSLDQKQKGLHEFQSLAQQRMVELNAREGQLMEEIDNYCQGTLAKICITRALENF